MFFIVYCARFFVFCFAAVVSEFNLIWWRSLFNETTTAKSTIWFDFLTKQQLNRKKDLNICTHRTSEWVNEWVHWMNVVWTIIYSNTQIWWFIGLFMHVQRYGFWRTLSVLHSKCYTFFFGFFFQWAYAKTKTNSNQRNDEPKTIAFFQFI